MNRPLLFSILSVFLLGAAPSFAQTVTAQPTPDVVNVLYRQLIAVQSKPDSNLGSIKVTFENTAVMADVRSQAAAGNLYAQDIIGFAYSRGWGSMPKNYAQAASWFRKAADHGFAEAQYNLGLVYTHGQGVPQDYVQAATWFRKAADQGNADAQTYLGTLYFHGWGVPQDDARAAFWYRKAADQGNADAQYNLGLVYTHGQGVPQDYVQAASWYRKAADQGNADAQYNLGLAYAHGLGVSRDPVKAEHWFQLSAAQGDQTAGQELRTLPAGSAQ
jgi:TPR repeat protein